MMLSFVPPSLGLACEAVVLEPKAGVGVPRVLGHRRWRLIALREDGPMDFRAESPWTGWVGASTPILGVIFRLPRHRWWTFSCSAFVSVR